MINVQSPITPFGLKAASAITNLKHEAAPGELPGQPPEKKPKISAESALKMKEAASALTGLARSISDENEPPPKFTLGLSAQKPPKKNGAVSSLLPSLKSKAKVAVAPAVSAVPPYPIHHRHPHHLHHVPPPMPNQHAPMMLPPRRANPITWMWPSLLRPPHVFGSLPNMRRQPPVPQPAETGAPVRHQRRPVKPKPTKEWTDDDEQRLKDLEAEYRREQARSKKQAWTLASHAPAPVRKLSESEKTVVQQAEEYEEKEFEVAQEDEEVKPSTVSSADSIKQELMASYPNVRKKRTTWSDEEDERLKSIVSALDPEGLRRCNWTDVARLMPERDSKQCRDRWLNHLDPVLAKHLNAPWTAEEDRKLIMFIKTHGTRWRLMQLTILPNRSELTIKNRWNSSMKRRYTRYLADKWNVDPNSIQLLNAQGLLHPGVSVEQMLEVAQCNLSQINRHFGEPLSNKDELVVSGQGAPESSTVKTIVDKMNEEHKEKVEDKTPTYVRVFKTKMSDAEVREDLGIIQLPQDCCFASTRATLFQRFGLDSTWKFSLPEFGIITAKQELDLGRMRPLMKRLGLGKGTRLQPVELSVVEQA